MGKSDAKGVDKITQMCYNRDTKKGKRGNKNDKNLCEINERPPNSNQG